VTAAIVCTTVEVDGTRQKNYAGC